MNELPEYDLVVHLCGGQTLPIHYGVRLLRASRHVFAITRESEKQFGLFRALLSEEGTAAESLEIPSDSPDRIKERILEKISGLSPEKVAVNLTGGTKLMFAGGMEAVRSGNVHGYYVDTPSRKIHHLHEKKTPPTSIPRIFSSVDDFFRLVDEKVSGPGHWADDPLRNKRIELSKTCWQQRFWVGNLGGRILIPQRKQLVQTDPVTHRVIKYLPFEKKQFINPRDKKIASATLRPDYSAEIVFPDETLQIDHCPDLVDYLGGGWLEEYCFQLLSPLLEKGKIKDLRIGLTTELPKPPPPGETSQETHQELDLCYTDGYELFIVECKSGYVNQGHVQKLENLIQKYAGSLGRGIITGTRRPSSQMERINRSPRITALSGNYLEQNFSRQATNPEVNLNTKRSAT